MNNGELRTYISAYVSRTDLTDQLFTTWQQNADQRIRRDCSLLFLDTYLQVVNPAGDSIAVPNMTELLSIAVVVQGRPVPLKLVSWEQYNAIIATALSGDFPEYYTMFGQSGIKVAPGSQDDYTFNIHYKGNDVSDYTDADTSTILQQAQSLYIEAVLMEVYKYLRDVEGEQLATGRYDAEVVKYNQFYEWQHSGANPDANTGAWQWH